MVGLTRDERGDEIVESGGGEPHRGDLFEPDSLEAGAADADVVIHAATAIPTEGDDGTSWALNDRVRREGTENLTAATAAVGAGRFLQQSIVWVARPPDGSPFDEASPLRPTPTTASAIDAERIATEAGQENAFDVGVLRCGWFYAEDSATTQTFGERLMRRRLPIVGGGFLGRRDAPLSFLHLDDAARAFAAAVEVDSTGTWRVVDDERVSFADFVRALADRLDAPSPFRFPGWLARLVLSADEVRLLTTPMLTSNERFCNAVDWLPTYPTYREGLDAVKVRWRETGFLT